MTHETFRAREETDGAIWWHFDRLTLVYSEAECQITLATDVSQVTDLTGKTLPAQAGDTLTVNGNPIYLHKRHPHKDATP